MGLFESGYVGGGMEKTFTLLPVEVRLLYRVPRKAFQGPTHRRLFCDKIYSVEIKGCPCPILVHPAMKNVKNKVFSKAKTKASVKNFCFMLKLSLLESRKLLSNLSTHHGILALFPVLL